ncbi:DUF4407 domain-containing protein [Faucicola boevrei]|uniref:DUF4407 domain-containing protein n=1 Tax=Faucicola boevrei TaxID=346665 RepID=UPI00037A2C95|nr:DUF4407 domain-containing protein [Moraxella boevrei]
MLKRIWYFLTFKTYQNNLLTSGGANYLSVIAVIVSLAALSEAFAWGHFGSTFTPDNPYLGGLTLGIFIFLLFWFFDRTMVTQDMMGEEHAKILEGDEYNPSFLNKYKSNFIFLIRLCIVMGSLYITAPFLTQLVFKTDIENEMQVQYQTSIENAKQETLGNIEKKLREQETYIREINQKLQQEISGKRGTGYGKGVVAQSIETELNTANSEFENLKQQLATTKTTLDTAIIQDDTKTLESFGIFMVKDSPIFRENSIQKLKTEPAFQNTQYAVDGFLILVGVILILSKLLQPSSLKMYYSSRLQEAWANYKNGNYDDYLLESEKSIYMPNMPIPQTFEKIAIHYAQTKNERIKDDIAKKQKQKQAQLNQEMEHQKIKESERVYNERQAKEVQRFSYEDKVTNQKKGRISHALKQTYSYKQKFMQEEYPNKEPLLAKQDELEQALFEAKRLYESKQEDATARQKRLQNEQNKLAELQQLAQEQEQKDNTSLENVKSFIVTQEALEKQKQTIKNMQDNYLSFERDMNSHKEKVANLTQELNHITEQIEAINDKEKQLNAIISDLELEELKFLTAVAKSNTTAYLKGDDNELTFIAQKKKMNNGVYEFTHFNTPEKVVNDE